VPRPPRKFVRKEVLMAGLRWVNCELLYRRHGLSAVLVAWPVPLILEANTIGLPGRPLLPEAMGDSSTIIP